MRGIIAGMTQTQAYRDAGYKSSAPEVSAIRLLNREDIQARKAYLERKSVQAADIDSERVMRENACIAFSDPKDLLDANGRPLPLEQIPERLRRAISSIEITELPDGRIKHKVKFWSKDAAVDRLFKNMGLYEEDNTQKTPQFLLAVGRADADTAKRVEANIVERDRLEQGDTSRPLLEGSDTEGGDILSRIKGLECPE